jgi:hypothetical protein
MFINNITFGTSIFALFIIGMFFTIMENFGGPNEKN